MAESLLGCEWSNAGAARVSNCHLPGSTQGASWAELLEMALAMKKGASCPPVSLNRWEGCLRERSLPHLLGPASQCRQRGLPANICAFACWEALTLQRPPCLGAPCQAAFLQCPFALNALSLLMLQKDTGARAVCRDQGDACGTLWLRN